MHKRFSQFCLALALLCIGIGLAMPINGCATSDGNSNVNPTPSPEPAYSRVNVTFNVATGNGDKRLNKSASSVHACAYNKKGENVFDHEFTKGNEDSYGSFSMSGNYAVVVLNGVPSSANSVLMCYYDFNDKFLGLTLHGMDLGDSETAEYDPSYTFQPGTSYLKSAAQLVPTPSESTINVDDEVSVTTYLEAEATMTSGTIEIKQDLTEHDLLSITSVDSSILEQTGVTNRFTGKSTGMGKVTSSFSDMLENSVEIEVK